MKRVLCVAQNGQRREVA